MLNLDPTWLFLSLIPSGIGFVLFSSGRKQGRWPQIVGGLAFMIYPFFAPGLGSLVGVGLGIGAALYYTLQMGW